MAPLFNPAPKPPPTEVPSPRQRRRKLTQLVQSCLQRCRQRQEGESKGQAKVQPSTLWTSASQRPPPRGYYGCGSCLACSNAVFGEQFLVQATGSWFQITDSLDCSSRNVLYLATCMLCPSRPQYGGLAVCLEESIAKHREEAERRECRADNDLSAHLQDQHGGWWVVEWGVHVVYAGGVCMWCVQVVYAGGMCRCAGVQVVCAGTAMACSGS